MASACIHEQGLGKVHKHLHPNIVCNIDSYKEGRYYIFPTYHGCRYRNRNGTRKKIQYNRGEQCLTPVHTFCGRPVKKKYSGNPVRVYRARYRKNYFKDIKNLFLVQMLNYSCIKIILALLTFRCFRGFKYRNRRARNEFRLI